MFTLADNKVSPNFDSRGYIMISGALLADAVIGNIQEKNMKKYGGSSNEVVSTQLSSIHNPLETHSRFSTRMVLAPRSFLHTSFYPEKFSAPFHFSWKTLGKLSDTP